MEGEQAMITLYFKDFTLRYESYVEIVVKGDSFILRPTKVCLNPSSGGGVYIPDTITKGDGELPSDGNKYFSILIRELVKIEYHS